MASNKRLNLDLNAFFEREGYQFVRRDEDGMPIVRNIQDNTESRFDAPAFIQSEGLDPAQVEFNLNTVENPDVVSPLTFNQRAIVKGLGNERGQLNYLRQNFDAVFPHSEHGLLVKKDGVWSKVDPGIFEQKDPWKMAEELKKDIADLGDVGLNILAAGSGAATGTSIGSALGPAGAVVGGIIGAGVGGLLSGALRTNLGVIAGTYEATPEEEMGDIALEGILSLAGQGVAIGVKPGIQALLKAGAKLKNTAIKEGLTAAYGTMSGVGQGSMRELIDNTPGVVKSMQKAIQKAGGKQAGSSAAINASQDIAIADTKELLEQAGTALSKKYSQQLDSIFTAADKAKMKIDMKSLADDMFDILRQDGYGVVEINKKGIASFRPYNATEHALRIQQGLEVAPLDAVGQRSIRNFVNNLNGFRKAGVLTGQNAAKQTQRLNKILNDSIGDAFRNKSPQAVKRAAARLMEQFRNRAANEMQNAGLGDKWRLLQTGHSEFADVVAMGRRLLNQENGAENLLGRLLNDSGKNRAIVGSAKKLAELVDLVEPGKGTQLLRGIQQQGAASKFLRWMPKFGLLQAAVTGGGIGSALTGGLSPFSAAILTQFSPRFIANQTRVIRAFGNQLNFLKSLPGKARESLLGSPEIFDDFIRLPLIELGQDQTLQQLLREQTQESIGGF